MSVAASRSPVSPPAADKREAHQPSSLPAADRRVGLPGDRRVAYERTKVACQRRQASGRLALRRTRLILGKASVHSIALAPPRAHRRGPTLRLHSLAHSRRLAHSLDHRRRPKPSRAAARAARDCRRRVAPPPLVPVPDSGRPASPATPRSSTPPPPHPPGP